MKRIFLTSLVIVLVSALLFTPVYLLLIHTVQTKAEDYSDDVVGSWKVFQFYKGSERVVCDEDTYMTLAITENQITITGTVLPTVKTTVTWTSGTAFSYEADGETASMFVSFDNHNNLKLTTADGAYILLLRKEGG